LQSLQEKRIPDALIEERAGRYRVLVGKGNILVEAWLIKEDLLKFGVEGFIARGSDESCASIGTTTVIGRMFGLRPGELSTLHQKNLAGVAAYEELEKLDVPGNRAAYKQALIEALPRVSPEDPLLGYILVNLGSFSIQEGDLQQARVHLHPVARGLVPCAANHRLMAMRRYAWVTHQFGHRLRAYRCYREILEQSDDPSVRTTCELELAGLALELAESGKGSHQEVRNLIEESQSRVPSYRISAAATFELMHLETWARQPDPEYKKAALLAEAFVAKWEALGERKPVREINAAKYQAGMFHRKAGDTEKAIEWYTRTFNEVSDSDPAFKGIPPKAEALLGMANIAHAANDDALRQSIREDILRYYPDSLAASTIRRNSPEMAERIRATQSQTINEGTEK